MHKINVNRVSELMNLYEKVVDIAKDYAKAEGVEYTENLRKSINRHVNKLDKSVTQETIGYEVQKVLTASKDDGTLMSITEFCETYGIPYDDVKSYKLITHTGRPTYNIASKTSEIESVLDVDSLVNKFKDIVNIVEKSPEVVIKDSKLSSKVLKVIFTDLHVGAEVSGDEKTLFTTSWTKKDIVNSMLRIIDEVKEMSKLYNFNKVVVEDLGDLVDGYDSTTTRKSHTLPQNMSNEDMFDNAMTFKVNLITHINSIFKHKIPIELHSVCNDNHGGSFTYIINSAVKSYLEAKFSNVKCTNHRKFISHYFCGNHAFILSHGKDDTHMKFGFTVPANQKGIDKIQEYMKINNLYSRGYFVSFNKGDTHVQQLDESCSDDFSYNSYMALSPSTQWVQHNFKRGKRGFNLQVFEENTRGIQNKPVFIEYDN